MLWLAFGLMLLAGTLFLAWPLYRSEHRVTAGLALGVVAVLASSGLLYRELGSPGAPAGSDALPSVDQMVTGLEARLEANPADVEGWKLLGRSYVQLQQFDRAIDAFGQALERGNADDAQTLTDLGEALLRRDGDVRGRPAELFEAALAAAPNNPKALFYGGIAAIERGNRAQAAERWEALLALSPPPEIQDLLRQRIAQWRGTPAPAPASADTAVVTVDVALGDAARAAVPSDATVYVIARDPAQPSPPIAAVRRRVSELPARVSLDDGDAMMPGRRLSALAAVELVARVSLSGRPVPQPGDWYGQAQAAPGSVEAIRITIDRQVEQQ